MYRNKKLLGLAFGIFSLCSPPVVAQALDVSAAKDIIERTLSGQNTGNEAIKLSFLVLNKDGSTQMERAAHHPFYSGELMRVKILTGQNGTLQLTNINSFGKATPMRPTPVQAGVPAYYPPENNAVLEFANAIGNETLRVSFTPQSFPLPNNTPGNSGQAAYPAANPLSQPYAPSQSSVEQMPGQVGMPLPSTTVYTPPTQRPGGMVNGNYADSYLSQGTPSPTLGGVGSVSAVNAPNPIATGATSPSATPSYPSRPSEFFSGVQGKAYAYAKDIRETVLETPNATYLVRPIESGPLQFDVSIQHRNF